MIERWGWNVGLILISSIFFVMAFSEISGPRSLDATTKAAFAVPGGLLGLVLVIEIGGAAALVAGIQRRTGAIVLSIFMIITTIATHPFWSYPAAVQQLQLLQFLKNLAITGGLIFVAARRGREDGVPASAAFVGRLFVALIFLMNAFGIINQEHAAKELGASGIPQQLVAPLMLAGRITQAIGGALLLWRGRMVVIGAAALIGFLFPATLIAHDFWRAAPDLWWSQLTNCFKNIAAVGSLAVIAAYYSRR